MKNKIIKNIKFIARTPEFRVLLLLAVCAFFILSVDRHSVQAGVGTANAGTLVYGDTTNAGTPKFQNLTYSDTFSAEMAGPAASASGVSHVIAKNAPTRDEVITGHLKVDGRLDVNICVTGCDSAGEMTNSFNKTGIAASVACNTTSGDCTRPFDIAYEQLNGRALVAFGLNATAGTLQYCWWDGSAWSPGSCTTPSTYAFDTAKCGADSTGLLRWVRLVPRGDGLKDLRSNEILAVVSDTNDDIFAVRWSGSAWGNCTLITNDTSSAWTQAFDAAWENTTGNAMVVYADTGAASTNTYDYKRWIKSNTTWDASGTAMTQTNSRIGHWVDMATAYQAGKNHIAIMTVGASVLAGTTGNGVPYIWDGSTMTKGNEWASIESSITDESAVAIEALNTNVQALFISTTGSASDATSYQTWVEGTGFSAVTDVTGAMADDAESHKLISSPNRNDIYLLGTSIDDGLEEQRWSGSGWNAAFSIRETALAPGAVSANSHGPEKGSYDMAIRPYSPWQRNWRFYSGQDNASVPTTALANQNTAPTGFDPVSGVARLRINYAERAALGSIDARKKLQYATGCTPNSAGGEAGCTWTDVDDAVGSGIWRFKDISCTATDCADGTLLTGTVLTGSGACSLGNGCGTWVMDKDAAAGTNMDHNTLQIQESEWVIESNNAAASTTYYFRVYDVDQLSPQYREQDASDCGTGGTDPCTYPSLATGTRAFTQAAYRFYTNADSTTPGSPLANLNTPFTLTSAGQQFRLRMLISSNQFISSGSESFGLQYASLGAYASCSLVPSGDFAFFSAVSSSGPRYGTSASGWTNPSNALSDDGSVATASLGVIPPGNNSGPLTASDYGFTIPTNATITGIEVNVKRRAQSGISSSVESSSVKLMKSGSPVGNNLASFTSWDTVLAYETFGSSSQMWGTTWSPSDVNGSGFGIEFIAENNGSLSDTAEVDAMRIKVYYTVPSAISFYNNPTPLTDANISTTANDPTNPGQTVNPQTYLEDETFTNSQNSFGNTVDAMWDVSLFDNGAPEGASYCFRAVKGDGTVLGTYTQYPMITTYTSGPTMDQVMRGGLWFNAGAEQDYYWAR